MSGYGVCNMLKKEFLSDIFFDDHTMIKVDGEGISCSHNTFKKLCIKCAAHWAKDTKLREAFYEMNRKYMGIKA
jgi:hypothetical protein